MDINDLRALATLLTFLAFVGVCFWAYSSRRKERFDEAARLPFADDETESNTAKPDSNGRESL